MSLRISIFPLLLLSAALLTAGCINSYTSSPHPEGDYDLDVELPEYDEVEPELDRPEGDESLTDNDASDSEEMEGLEQDGELEGDFEDAEPGEAAENPDADGAEGDSTETE